MKFRVQIPGTVEEALCLDKDDGNDLWKQAIEKEWKNFCISCNLLDCGESAPIGYKEITFHLRLCPNKKYRPRVPIPIGSKIPKYNSVSMYVYCN